MLKVRLDDSKLNTQDRKLKARRAAQHLQNIVNSDKFRDAILSMDPKWRLGEVSEYKDYSNLEIYNLLMSGSEESDSDADNEIDLLVDDYYSRFSRVVGYMLPGNPVIFVNTKFFDTMELKYVVSNFLHEWSHTVGFRHDGPNLRFSIPYFLNTVVEDLFVDDVPEIKGYWVCKRRFLRKKCYWVTNEK